MREMADGAKAKAQLATECVEDLVLTAQGANLGTRGFVYLLSIAKYGESVTPIVEAQVPAEIDVERLRFGGDSGRPNLDVAIDWVTRALELSLEKCRSVPAYDERNSPLPLVAILCDSLGLEPDFWTKAARLRQFPFEGGMVNIVTCGIGLKTDSANAAVQASFEATQGWHVVVPSVLSECLAPLAGEGCFSWGHSR
jgi:hypothetical protein